MTTNEKKRLIDFIYEWSLAFDEDYTKEQLNGFSDNMLLFKKYQYLAEMKEE